MKNKKCVVLLSGGLDSTTTLFYVLNKGYEPVCLIFDYGQRHKREIKSAINIAKYTKCKYFLVKTSFPWKGSSLLNAKLPITNYKFTGSHNTIPPTYVPARNIIFLSYAVSLAEVIDAKYIFFGANQIDFSGYPDCRKEFVESFQHTISVGTKAGVEGKHIKIMAPFINFTKKDIVQTAVKLKVPIELTWSCYKGGKKPCGKCDSCKLRQKGFQEVGLNDPLLT